MYSVLAGPFPEPEGKSYNTSPSGHNFTSPSARKHRRLLMCRWGNFFLQKGLWDLRLCMMEWYVSPVQEHLSKVVLRHQRYWDSLQRRNVCPHEQTSAVSRCHLGRAAVRWKECHAHWMRREASNILACTRLSFTKTSRLPLFQKWVWPTYCMWKGFSGYAARLNLLSQGKEKKVHLGLWARSSLGLSCVVKECSNEMLWQWDINISETKWMLQYIKHAPTQY